MSPTSRRAPSTASARTVPTRPVRVIASTRPSSSSIPTRGRSREASPGTTRSAAIARAMERGGLEPDGRDSAPFTPRSVVVDGAFDWDGDRPPAIPWHRTVIYEAHLKGLTARHPDLPPALRGTYAGLAAPPVIDYLRGLGVTAVELLPVHHAVSERALVARGLTNYWGYNSIGYFAPDARFAAAGTPRRAGRRVQGHGARAAPRGHRGDPRRGLQPHRGGRRAGAHAGLPRAGQQRLLLARPRRPGGVRGLDGLRQYAGTRGIRARSSS